MRYWDGICILRLYSATRRCRYEIPLRLSTPPLTPPIHLTPAILFSRKLAGESSNREKNLRDTRSTDRKPELNGTYLLARPGFLVVSWHQYGRTCEQNPRCDHQSSCKDRDHQKSDKKRTKIVRHRPPVHGINLSHSQT